jgi:hypothetical protein
MDEGLTFFFGAKEENPLIFIDKQGKSGEKTV